MCSTNNIRERTETIATWMRRRRESHEFCIAFFYRISIVSRYRVGINLIHYAVTFALNIKTLITRFDVVSDRYGSFIEVQSVSMSMSMSIIHLMNILHARVGIGPLKEKGGRETKDASQPFKNHLYYFDIITT